MSDAYVMLRMTYSHRLILAQAMKPAVEKLALDYPGAPR
jgi:hypothetical protein